MIQRSLYYKIWNSHHPDDPMPERGFVIHHIDENRENNNIENLIKVTRAQHMVIHKTGVPFTDEHKRRLAESKFGENNPAKRKEVREKISNTLTGRPSPRKGVKTGKPSWMTGKHHTEEANQKNREKHLGKVPWNKNIPCSEQTKLKLSIAKTGKKASAETRKKMSESQKRRYQNDQ